MELKVALCQFDMVWEDTAANLRTAGRMVAEADADLVILPEMFATGFETDPGRVAQPMSGEIVQEMTRWGRTMGKAVAGSLIVEEEGRYYNRLLFIKPSGERVQSDKRHLFSIGGEGANFCPGRERVVVEYGGIRFLLQVCYDLRFPVWSRCRNDYDAIIYVASWPAGRRDVWRTLLRARAIENQAYVLGVNRTGDDPRLHYSGDSAVIGCKGETLAEAGEGQRLLTARLDMDELRRFREKFPAWRDADDFRSEVIGCSSMIGRTIGCFSAFVKFVSGGVRSQYFCQDEFYPLIINLESTCLFIVRSLAPVLGFAGLFRQSGKHLTGSSVGRTAHTEARKTGVRG